jgi:hypothetical protein
MVIFGDYMYFLVFKFFLNLYYFIGNCVPQKQGVTHQYWYVPMLIHYGVLDFTLMIAS